LIPLTSSGDPAERYGISVKRELSCTASDASFATAQEWLDTCKSNHICAKKLPLKDHDPDFQTWPARLVDVEAFAAPSRDVRLVANDGSRARYATLSYCWGRTKTLATTTRSLRLRERRIPFGALPRTFRDAVCVARRLGVRWLWIDALCIVQDDPADWERESVKMGAIYSLAYVTVAADAGVDCDSGCFNERSTSQDRAFDAPPLALRVRVGDVAAGGDVETGGSSQASGASTATGGGGGDELSTIHLWDPSARQRRPTPPEIDASPLAARGWVCQERILSPRILHYTHAQLFWECRETLLAEDNLRPWAVLPRRRWFAAAPPSSLGASTETLDPAPDARTSFTALEAAADDYPAGGGDGPTTACGLARSLYGTTTDPAARLRLLRVWYAAVVARAYSRRRLTLPADKLPALSGLARAFARHLRVGYLAGLWRLGVAWGLAWRRVRGGADAQAADGDEGPAGRAKRGRGKARAKPAAPPRREYRAPSFSWAARDCAVEWPAWPAGAMRDGFADGDVAADVPLAGADPFGRVAPGCALAVRGFVRGAVVAARRRLRASGGPPGAGRGAAALLPGKRPAPADTAPAGSEGGGGVEWAWELRGARGQWLGTAFLDDDPGEPEPSDPDADAEADADGRAGPSSATGEGAAREVDCLVLGRDERSGQAHLLLLERVGAAAAAAGGGVRVVRRCGVAEVLGLEDETDLFDERHLVTLRIL
jgi:hypothetical protein